MLSRERGLSNLTRLFVIATLFVTVAAPAPVTATPGAKTAEGNTSLVAAQENTPLATSDKAHPDRHLFATVVDPSGAVIAGATVEVLRVDDTVQLTTQL